MKFKAVLFDLDGTLLDTLEDIADSMNGVLRQLGFTGHKVEAYKYFVGEGMEALCKQVLPDGYRNTTTIKQCLERMREEYGKRWAQKTKIYEGIPELLAELVTRGIKMAVLSNKLDDFTKLMVARLLARWHFNLVVGQRQAVPAKPDPTAALAIARHLKISPHEFVYLGDTGIDMKTAIAAGMYPVGVLWGFRKAEELIASGAKIVIAKPTDLLAFL